MIRPHICLFLMLVIWTASSSLTRFFKGILQICCICWLGLITKDNALDLCQWDFYSFLNKTCVITVAKGHMLKGYEYSHEIPSKNLCGTSTFVQWKTEHEHFFSMTFPLCAGMCISQTQGDARLKMTNSSVN